MPENRDRRLLPDPLRLPLMLLLIGAISLSCEKDDICVDGDTPLLGVSFREQADSITLKPVTLLRALPVGQVEPPDTYADRSDLSEISIPLNVARDTTAYLFIQNSADTDGVETGNIDTLLIIYRVDPTFVSRACGFIAEFDSLQVVVQPDSNPWIQGARFTTGRLVNNTFEPLLHVYF